MRIKYIKIDNPEKVNYKINWQIPYERFPLTIGQEYTVYAIEYTEEGRINFFIIDEGGNTYPHNYPSEFFIVTDNRMSKYWEGLTGKENYPIDTFFPNLITFKEWKCNKFFEEEMMDNIGQANTIFKKYKSLIDNEFSNNQLQNAVPIGDNWVMCFNCNNSWEIANNNGVIECPKCKTRQNNPYY
ncbi:hypothetical protein ATE47_12375 [Chryseobacterium sp. IHB B 17019]|uniref:hypothetical protein n=1 Tax=Chryseobacterium sp. IHB B 17019 TaxID=1721091 RepID=UPI00071EDC4A|nr:hypothetical protein [Chryseobacterium sp. IHB B 17019]ALR31268.1 hypothetical protein ATE47_12375 [Chryseobacterium sp. IHB B 17019]